MAHYRWPGNVREVYNVIERLLVLGSDTLETGDLDGALEDYEPWPEYEAEVTSVVASSRAPTAPPERRRAYGDDDEREHLASEMIRSGGNVSWVSRRLGMARSTLRYKIRQYDLGHLIPTD